MPNRSSIAALFVSALATQAAASAAGLQAEAARDYLVHAWRTDDGLPQNWVSSIVQTPDGYLWIGTRYGGLARFDGVRFVDFNPLNTRALADVQVEHLSVDETGRLWILMGNESVTALDSDGFHLLRGPRVEPRLRSDRVLSVRSDRVLFAGEYPYLPSLDLAAGTNGWSVFDPRPNLQPDPGTFSIDADNVIWFITFGRRLGRFEEGRFELMTDAHGLADPTAVALAIDPSHQLWVASPRRLMSWDGEAFVDRTPTNGPPPAEVEQIAFGGDAGLWVLEQGRLRKCLNGAWVAEADPEAFQPDGGPGRSTLRADVQGNAWLIRHGEGLWHVKGDGSTHLLTEEAGLPSVFITCWFQDIEQNIWIGTAGGGIARIRESLFRALGPAAGLPGKVVRSVCVDADGDLWAGTMSGGLARWHEGRFVSIPLPSPDGSPTESVTVLPQPDGGVWVGTLNHGLMRLNNGEVNRVQTPWPDIRVLFGDSRERLWVGPLVNLFRYSDGRLRQFGAGEGFVNSHAIGAMAEDAEGVLWIGTGPGDLWKCRDDEFTRFTPPSRWPSVRFSAVLPDTNGVVWVGTLGAGLLRFRGGEFTRCAKENGLPDDNVSQLLDSGDGYLWAGTYAGIFRARKTDLEAVTSGRRDRVPCRVYGRFDGLPSLECSSGFQPSCWRSSDGRLCFATANGVVTVDPLQITRNPVAPIVIIEEMLVDGDRIQLPRPGSLAEPTAETASVVRIGPGRHYVQFRFTGLNFSAPDGVRFRVKLEGADRDWQSVGGQRLMGYGPLIPGAYEFRVIACNNDELWNEVGDSLRFTVEPFFWQRWWFKAALTTAALTALGLAVALAQRRRYRRRLEKVERQREMERERTRIAQDLHDDLGATLTQISLLSAMANREQTSPTESRQLVQHVRDRAREMVTALDEIVWSVNPKHDSVVELVSYLGHFAEAFFRPTGIRCRLDIPKQLPSRPLPAEARHHLFLAFKEALNNVARHSRATQVRVQVRIHASALDVRIRDDGCGFERHDSRTARTGNGLTNMGQRMEHTGGYMRVETEPAKGTTVTLHLPFG